MSKFVRKTTLWVLSLLFALCVSLLGIHTVFSVNAENTPSVVNLTFNTLGLNGGENNDTTIVSGRYLTTIRFNQGVFTGSTNADTAVYDYSNVTENAVFTGEGEYGFVPGATRWATGYKTDALFNFIYLWTANQPVANDTLVMKANSYFIMQGTMADGTLCNDKYVLAEDINLKFNGTAWEYYVPVVDNTQFVTEFTNNGQFVVGNYNGDATSYPYEIIDGATASLPTGYTGAVAKIGSKINGGAAYINIDFTASQISAADVESVVARVYSPDYTADDQLRINNVGGYIEPADLSNWCNVVIPVANITGNDGNLGSFAFGLRDKGTVSDYFYIDSITIKAKEAVATTPVTFTHINSSWNDNTATLGNGMHYTVLHLDGLLTSGYYTQGDDWTEMKANATINGGESYFNFCPASYIAGPDVAANFIVLYTEIAPVAGDEFFIPAGTTFKVGGNDTNIYKLASDISLKFNGTAWEVFVPEAQPPVEPPVEPDEPTPVEPVLVKLTSANGAWNNFDYTDQGYFCTFLHFEGGIDGGGLDGDFSNLLSNVTLNGQPLDTENVSFVCARWIGWENGIILRFKTLPQENSILVFPAGTTFTVGGEDANVYEISETMELKMKNGKWNIPLPTAEFIGVNEWNNNIVTLAGSRLTILDFDVTAMGNAVSTDKNWIAMAGVSINGVKLTDIDGASITYMHGDNHMGIDIPASAIYPTQEYPITILKVAAGTVFENYELPEITLSLIGGTWVVGEFETMPEEDEYVTISDITGEERVELGSEGLMSAMDGFAGDVNFKFVYRSDEAIMNYAPYGGLSVYLNSTNSWDGWRIFFVGNVVYVYDATMGGAGDEHVLLGQAEFGIASSFEMQIEISVKQVGGKYSIVIGGSCAKILELNDITPIGDCIGGGISLYSATRSCSVKDYKYGDVFDPVLTINSKQEIVIKEGEAVPEIDATAVDGLTEITPTYVWDEGAITDGKMNVGVWNCVVTATDANGNYATATVRVTVKGEAKYMVTFDGANEGKYAYGEKIVKPADPTKEATKKYQYTFDGWYNGDEKWDFDHDIVTSDVALVAKFIESDVYYKVAVTVSSETQTIYVTYGAQVDLSVFDKEGFEKEVKQNGKVITKLIVTEDTAIEITYTQSASNTPSGCAGGCAGSLTGVGGIGVLLTLIGGGMLMRKKEETDEK